MGKCSSGAEGAGGDDERHVGLVRSSRSTASMSSTTTGSSSTTTGSSSRSSSSTTTSITSEQLPNGLTVGPGLTHILYMLTLYRYVLLCFLFGLLSVVLGLGLLSMAIMIRSKTISVHLLESVPLYMPSMILICNGASMMAFMHKQSRRFYLLKCVCGLFLLSALLLIIVAVTTSIIHLPRLHSHTQCAYTGRLRACTCVQKPIDSTETSIASKHFIMEEIANCDLVHGTLYDSLRVVFAISLVAILTSVFSIMTLYQLYIYEKQKIYFSQINTLRHRIHNKTLQEKQHQHQQPHHHHHYHRHSAASVLKNDGQSSHSNSNYLIDHFNHLYAIDGMAANSAVKCLSAEFSSQDLLLDQSSTNFGVSKPKSESYQQQISRMSNNDRGSRIWSSQLSSASGHFHVQTSDVAPGSSENSENRPLCFDQKIEADVQTEEEEEEDDEEEDEDEDSSTTDNDDNDDKKDGETKMSSPEEVVSLTAVPSNQFTFGSSSQPRLDNHQSQHYLTTFEEAFKNYYDSQHRLSSGAADSHNTNHLSEKHDINGQHYFTMPVKKSEHQRSKRRRTYITQVEIPIQGEEQLLHLQQHNQANQDQHQSVFCINTDQHNSMMMPDVVAVDQLDPPCLIHHHNQPHHPLYCPQVNENINFTQQPQITVVESTSHHHEYISDEDPFPAIEPPADYKNAVTNHMSAESKARTMDQLTSQLMQPYQIWMQQFIEKMNALNYTQMEGVEDEMGIAYESGPIQVDGTGDDYATNGNYVDEDDDDAGDTSTSQDLADFELELDEEPIRFVAADEEYKKPIEKPVIIPVERIHVEVQKLHQFPPEINNPIAFNKSVMPNNNADVPQVNQNQTDHQPQQLYPIDLLKKNTELILRAVKMNKATADYGFDGFRKGCFDDDSSSTSSSSSLTNGGMTTNDSHDNSSGSGSSQSITAEYIKPPTPFTNNFLCQ